MYLFWEEILFVELSLGAALAQISALGAGEKDRPMLCVMCNEQALVCLFNTYILDASRRQPFHRKMANNRILL